MKIYPSTNSGLFVTGPASATDNAVARYDGTTGKIIQNSAVTIADDGATVIDANSTSAGLRITQVGTGNALLVEDSANPDASPVVIDAAGRVIVGGTANIGGYQFQSQTTSGASFNASRFSNDSGSAFFRFDKSRSATIGEFDIVSASDDLGTILFRGADGTSLISAAQIYAEVDGTPGVNDMPGRLVLSTTADGASTPTERMRIDNAGNVGIGATANASALLDVQSTTKGVRMPNMTTVQKNAIASPAAGLMVFDTTLSKLAVYTGAAWQTITSV